MSTANATSASAESAASSVDAPQEGGQGGMSGDQATSAAGNSGDSDGAPDQSVEPTAGGGMSAANATSESGDPPPGASIDHTQGGANPSGMTDQQRAELADRDQPIQHDATGQAIVEAIAGAGIAGWHAPAEGLAQSLIKEGVGHSAGEAIRHGAESIAHELRHPNAPESPGPDSTLGEGGMSTTDGTSAHGHMPESPNASHPDSQVGEGGMSGAQRVSVEGNAGATSTAPESGGMSTVDGTSTRGH